jgi:uncharacterized membrane protein YdjX (TVP38/TMEM64 family)
MNWIYFFRKENYKQIVSFLLIAGFFVLASYFSQQNVEEVRVLILKGGAWSLVFYILAGVTATVVAPLTSIPLIPVVVQVWGVFLTSILSIISWTIGSLGAFWIARKFGAPVVSRMESVDKIREVVSKVPKKKIFWYLIFLRITIPTDILSYALGLFTNISWRMFFLTTLIGIVPMTFLFSYVGSLSLQLQIPLVIIGTITIVYFFNFHIRKGSRRK